MGDDDDKAGDRFNQMEGGKRRTRRAIVLAIVFGGAAIALAITSLMR